VQHVRVNYIQNFGWKISESSEEKHETVTIKSKSDEYLEWIALVDKKI
jgi:hypothetical protein